jgi:RNA polymerase sigma-70 factor, ECF subfamily
VASFVETHGHAGDEGNFEALYTTYRSDVQRLASYLLKNATDAEDAAQTVFLNVLRALRQGVTPSDPRAWLLAITRNVCFSRHRAAASRPVHVELDFEEPSGPTSDETPSADEIVGALARLLPNQRTALILRDFRGVSGTEICNLMTLTPVAVEALLTRARAAFREELEAGEQQFECAETRALVEQQLDGLITVADRHTLRSHLRHCASCSTLARAVRSSRGKAAAILFWPVDLISRLVAAFTQAPTVVHAAAALTTTAAVATIALPVAVSNGPQQLAHIEGRTAPGPVVPRAVAATIVKRPAPAASPAVSVPVARRAAAPAVRTVTWHHAAKAQAPAVAPSHRVHARPATHAAVHKTAAAPAVTAASVPVAVAAPHTDARPTTASAAVHTRAETASPTTSSSASNGSGSGITAPTASPSRSSSPAVKPAAKPKPKARPKSKPKPSRKGGKKSGKAVHPPAPPAQMPTSTPPATSLEPSGDAPADAGPGAAVGGGTTPAGRPSTSSGSDTSSDSSSEDNGSSDAGKSISTSKDGGKDDDGNKDKDKHKK